jgi:ligand-binding sensor domain-containing protein
MTLLRYVPCIVFITFYFTSAAQWNASDYDLFTTRSGLPHNHVLSITQDDKGFLWIGTRDGVCRYDGQDFISYPQVFGSEKKAWANAVEAICCYKDEVWIGTRSGDFIACLNTKTGGVRTIRLPIPHIGDYYGLKTVFVAAPDEVYAGTFDGRLLRINPKTNDVRAIKVSAFPIRDIRIRNGALLIYSDHLYEYNRNRNVLTAIHTNTAIPQWPVSALLDHTLMINYGAGEYTFYDLNSKTGKTITDENYSDHALTAIAVSGKDHFIITNGRLITLYSRDGKKLMEFNIDENETRDKWELINTVFEDQQGNIWLGIDHGLVKVIVARHRFNMFTSTNRFKKISHNYIRSLYAEGNTVWAGTWHGYINEIIHAPSDKQYHIRTYTFSGVGASTTNAIIRLRDGTLMATSQAGLFRLKNERFELFPIPGEKTRGDLWALMEDKRERIWISEHASGGNYLYIIDRNGNRTKRILHPSMVWNIYEDRNRNIWLGTEGGLEKAAVDSINDTVVFIHHKTFARNAPAGLKMWSLLDDTAGNIWIGTTDNGLLYYNTRTAMFSSFSEKDGLPGNSICGLLSVTPDRLWVSTTNGIAMLDLRSKQIISYKEEDGIISNDFNFKACTITPHGELFWGTKMGIMSFYQDSVKPHTIKDERIGITGINVMGKEIPPADTMMLAHNENMFSVKFALLDYTNHKHYYRYKLSGFNDIWSYADEKNPVATYTNIPPGKYRLLINAAISTGNWMPQDRYIDIIIQPAFWQQIWFYVLVVLVIAASISLVVYSRIKKIIRTERDRQLIRQKVTELELNALQAQMNPHFIFNAIHSIQHFIIKNDELNANEYLTKFANLMRLFLESSKRKYITLAEEIEILKLYTDLEKLRFEDRFALEFNIDPMLDVYKIEIPSMLLQPFVENAIIHGLIYLKHKGLLTIELKETGEGICCIIDDNGIGRTASRSLKRSSHPSRGMELTLDRINSYNELNNAPLCRISITDKVNASGEALGTRVEIYIQYFHQ